MLLSWLRSLGRHVQRAARSRGNPRPYHRRAILRVEALEDRTVPTTVAVINLNAAGAGSLAAAVAAVDASADANNTITFAQGLAGWIPLSGELDLKDTSGQAPNKSITITGPGSAVLGVNHGVQGNFRDFWVDSGINASISGLTVAQGSPNNNDAHKRGDGGGILNEGTLSLCDVLLLSNNTTGSGGGIANYGTLTTGSVVIRNNTAGGQGGGLYNAGTASFQNADQIYSNSTNRGSFGGGGIFNDTGATLNLSGTSIHDNQVIAGANGCGISNLGALTMSGGSIQNNQNAAGNGGGLYSDSTASVNLSGVSITGNTGNYGGGVYVWSGTVTCTDCTLTGNTATTYGSIGCWRDGKGILTETNCIIDGGTQGKDPRY